MVRHVRLHRWSPAPGEISERKHADPHGDGEERSYDQQAWDSSVVEHDFDVRTAVASWEASTPGGTWIEVLVRGGVDDITSPWLSLGRWAQDTAEIHRTTDSTHGPGYEVADDELRTDGWRRLQVRVVWLRPADTHEWPDVRTLALCCAGEREAVDDGRGGIGTAHAIDVPAYSQHPYTADDPRLGSGRDWCSPTSVTMALAYWGIAPNETPTIPYAAAGTYDYGFDGAGNWSFNTAYAATYGVRAFVTRLRSLAEAEEFTAAGIPLVLSVRFTADQLDGAGYDTAGHLLVLVGFDEFGDPVVNDPASHGNPNNAEVRTTYRRDQFGESWQVRAGGTAYVIHPSDVPLPTPKAEANW